MKIKVDIVLGFLKSGKTKLINLFLKSSELENEKMVVIQYEQGKTAVESYKNNVVIKLSTKDKFDKNFLKRILSEYVPDRIIIEYNGMNDTERFIQSLNFSYFNKLCRINNVINLIDSDKAEIYLLNLKRIFLSHIIYSSRIFINNCNDNNKEYVKQIINYVRSNNDEAKIVKFKSFNDIQNNISNKRLCLNLYYEKTSLKDVFKALFISVLVVAVLSFIVYLNFTGKSKDAEILFDSFKISFTSIILEAVPFVLIGSFIASIIQIFIPEKWIVKVLNKNKVVSSIGGALLGIVFPICDCGTIPIAFGFLNKGVPLNAVISFMLAAPIVNPISILSTFYAFPNDLNLVYLRVVMGILIAILSSFILGKYRREEIVNIYTENWSCDLCNGTYINAYLLKKIKGVFISCGDEFIKVSKYLIVGAVFTSIFQLLNSNNLLGFIPSNKICYLLFMMIAAFLLSVCSTSDAFVAKGFLNTVPLNSILGFLILGPMIDIKNTIMLTGYFKKFFVLKYIFTICIITFILILCIQI